MTTFAYAVYQFVNTNVDAIVHLLTMIRVL